MFLGVRDEEYSPKYSPQRHRVHEGPEQKALLKSGPSVPCLRIVDLSSRSISWLLLSIMGIDESG